MCNRNRIVVLLAAAVIGILPAGAGAQPGLQPGLVEALCPRIYPPDTDCYSIAYPGEVWAVAAILPIKDGAEDAYDALIPEPFFAIPDRREIAVLMFRLDVTMTLDRDIESDPGDGYAEGSVAIRVGFPAQDGFPYSEGWWTISQPLNDGSQYGAGRGIGLPKYMADTGVRIDPDGSWRGWAKDWANTGQPGGPGANPVPGGNVLEITWTADDPGIDEQRAQELWTWGQYGEPLFVQTPPYDQTGPHDAAMVKFTPVSIVPVYGAPQTWATAAPDPRVGTTTVTLEGTMPDGTPFSEIIEPGAHTVAGTSAWTRGLAFVTADNLENNKA